MAKVKEVIGWLSKLDPEDTIALTGWWERSDVEEHNRIKFTDEQWDTIVERHEDNTEVHIDEIVSSVIEEEDEDEDEN